MDFADYLACDATALAQHVARGEVSASRLLDLALGQQRRVHGSVNAVIRLMEPEARAQIDAGFSGGPFGGVPFLIKDAVQDYAGIPTTYASRSMAGIVPKRHAHVVERYLKSGLVIFGKTNLPEFAIRGVTDPELFGRTNNPWDLTRTPGGSSGGAAAAVASGIVPMAAGNDGGGSLRIPAACCGLFTVRPSRGRVSSGPDIGEVWFGASTEGVLSRSVRDSAMALDVLQGAEPGDPFVIAPPLEPYAQAMLREPGRLRIGFTSVSPIGTEVHPEAVLAVQRAARLLESLGHHVEEAAPQIDGAALAQSYLHMYFGQIPAAAARAKALGANADDLELMNRILEADYGAESLERVFALAGGLPCEIRFAADTDPGGAAGHTRYRGSFGFREVIVRLPARIGLDGTAGAAWTAGRDGAQAGDRQSALRAVYAVVESDRGAFDECAAALDGGRPAAWRAVCGTVRQRGSLVAASAPAGTGAALVRPAAGAGAKRRARTDGIARDDALSFAELETQALRQLSLIGLQQVGEDPDRVPALEQYALSRARLHERPVRIIQPVG